MFSDAPLLANPRATNKLSIVHVVVVMGAVLLVALLGASFMAHRSHISVAALRPAFWLFDATWRVMAIVMVLVFATMACQGGARGMGLKTGWAIGRGILIGLGAIAIAWPLVFLGSGISVMVEKAVFHHNAPQNSLLKAAQHHPSPVVLALMVLSLCVLAPISEELFFRGLLQSYLSQLLANLRRYFVAPQTPAPMSPPAAIEPADRWGAIFMSSAVFAFAHGEPSAFVALFLLGVALGYVYERTGNLWTDITMHSAFNGVSLVATLTLHLGH